MGITSARVATCSVAPTPRRVAAPEEILVGSRLEPEVITAAGHALAKASSPIDDARGTASYRRRVLPGLLARAIGGDQGDRHLTVPCQGNFRGELALIV